MLSSLPALHTYTTIENTEDFVLSCLNILAAAQITHVTGEFEMQSIRSNLHLKNYSAFDSAILVAAI